jgi:hypothetical protein
MEGFSHQNHHLVGGLEHEFYFSFHIWDVILPIDELIFFKMVIAPPTRSATFRTAGLLLDFCSKWVCAQKAGRGVPTTRYQQAKIVGKW